ncbi:ASCH domain-containing protein [Phytoactinopolyspora endophytica]|uniref:ASCH domain-containing protein n=1 Tax=Phytoactinopolyspora endophytica TaxID=1642495 RepID=UPI00101D5CDD|nr:ASCH domain-containing protein [Phytoactinopolyspora endophytica]
MDPLESERRVIEAAEVRARLLGENSNHTVAAAAMDTAGRIHAGVNVYHFTGGPCAEFVAMGLAATVEAGPLITMAAAGDRGRGLIGPCGRCRQAMLDLHPDILVAVPSKNGPQMHPIRKLLPGAYEFPDANALRVLRFNKRYYDSVIDGTKVSTIRWDETPSVGPAVFVFEDKYDHPLVRGAITGVKRQLLSELTPHSAHLPADADMAGYINGLRDHYPAMPPEAEVDIVTFHVEAEPT